MYKFKNIFLCSLIIFLFSAVLSPINASCIPQSFFPDTGCSLVRSGGYNCQGVYLETLPNPGPTCAPDQTYKKLSACNCTASWQSYVACPRAPAARDYYFNIGSFIPPANGPYCANWSIYDAYSQVTKQTATSETDCANWCKPLIVPTPTPVKVVVNGYVRNVLTGLPVAGARILVQKTDDKYGFCVGQHWGCSPDYVITDSAGRWTSSCIDTPMKSIFVKEVNNAMGFIDSSRYPDPAGASVWDKNTVCFQNAAGKTNIGPIVFYDLK